MISFVLAPVAAVRVNANGYESMVWFGSGVSLGTVAAGG
jgi:hypothetical protein